MRRPVQVFDGDGQYLGDFAGWDVAHRWAHQRAAEPGASLPVSVEDRAGRYSRQLWPNRCDLLPGSNRPASRHLPGLPHAWPRCPLTSR